MSALHRVKAPAVFDSELQARHAQRKRRDEAVARSRSAYSVAESKRKAAISPDAGRSMLDAEQQTGIPIHSDIIMRRLMKLNPNLWFEVSHANDKQYGVYLLDPGSPGGRQFICGMHRGMCREFITGSTDEAGELLGATVIPGWRRVIAVLIRKGLISEPKANALFGPPSRASQKWQALTT
jgi:hypothetical protein